MMRSQDINVDLNEYVIISLESRGLNKGIIQSPIGVFVKKVSEDNIRTTIITNQNNIKQNIIINLNGSNNKNYIINKKVKKENDVIKQNNKIYHNEN